MVRHHIGVLFVAGILAAACQRDNPAYRGQGDGGGGGGAGADGGNADAASDGPASDGGGPEVPTDVPMMDKPSDAAPDKPGADKPPEAGVDKPVDGAVDVSIDFPPDLPGESPPDAPLASGCKDSTREGFSNLDKFPFVAGCAGPPGNEDISWASAAASWDKICALGWHWCSAHEIGGLPDDDPGVSGASGADPCAWIGDTTEACGHWKFFDNAGCEGEAGLVSSMEGSAPCTIPADGCDQGWRAAVRFSVWKDSSVWVGACKPHISAACGAPESDAPKPHFCWVACCRDG